MTKRCIQGYGRDITSPKRSGLTIATLVMLAFFIVSHTNAQLTRLVFESFPYSLNSDSRPAAMVRQSDPAFQDTIRVGGARCLRVVFGETQLGPASYITLRSLKDGGLQRLDGRSLIEWKNKSAYFNGDAVVCELHASPGDFECLIRCEGGAGRGFPSIRPKP